MLEQERLIRELEVLNQVYITLRREHEITNIEEVENSNSIEVLDQPEVPINRTSPRRTFSVMISFFVGIIFSFTLIYFKDVVLPVFNDY